MRARDLGIRIGLIEPGPRNALSDVPGDRVGQTTLIEGDGPLERSGAQRPPSGPADR